MLIHGDELQGLNEVMGGDEDQSDGQLRGLELIEQEEELSETRVTREGDVESVPWIPNAERIFQSSNKIERNRRKNLRKKKKRLEH